MDDFVAGRFYARLIVESWHPAHSLQIVQMSADEFDKLTQPRQPKNEIQQPEAQAA
jgi:hypothetical protein